MRGRPSQFTQAKADLILDWLRYLYRRNRKPVSHRLLSDFVDIYPTTLWRYLKKLQQLGHVQHINRRGYVPAT